MTNYDYIIIGAGSAGCVLANRLTANDTTVLLLEAPWGNRAYCHLSTISRCSNGIGLGVNGGYVCVSGTENDRQSLDGVGCQSGGAIAASVTPIPTLLTVTLID